MGLGKFVAVLVGLTLAGVFVGLVFSATGELKRRETFDIAIATSAIPATRAAYLELEREGVIARTEFFKVYPSRVHVGDRWASLTEARMQELVYSAALESRSRDCGTRIEVVDPSGSTVARYDPRTGIVFNP